MTLPAARKAHKPSSPPAAPTWSSGACSPAAPPATTTSRRLLRPAHQRRTPHTVRRPADLANAVL